MSMPPPAGAPTTSLTIRDGKSWQCAKPWVVTSSTAASNVFTRVRDMTLLDLSLTAPHFAD